MRIGFDNAHSALYALAMGRLNISIPQALAPLVSKGRRKTSLPKICAQALPNELAAVESHRSAAALLPKLHRRRSPLEQDLIERFGLAEARVAEERARDD